LRAKIAVLRFDQFARAASPASRDSSIWARFAQPAALVHADSDATRARIATTVAAAIVTAAGWAALLGPADSAPPALFWQRLFERTYAAELRVEYTRRASDLVGAAAARYAAMLPLAWQAGRLTFRQQENGWIVPAIDDRQRNEAARRWRRSQRTGKAWNAARLAKAAFTFENGADYIAWKIERHTGMRLELSDWQRRHPLLAAPAVLWRLSRRRILR
jgi:hypothetical protein